MMTKEGSTKIVNFMTHGSQLLVLGRGHISHIVKMHNFIYKILYSQARFTQNSNDNQGRVHLNRKFHDPQVRGSCARHLLKMHTRTSIIKKDASLLCSKSIPHLGMQYVIISFQFCSNDFLVICSNFRYDVNIAFIPNDEKTTAFYFRSRTKPT